MKLNKTVWPHKFDDSKNRQQGFVVMKVLFPVAAYSKLKLLAKQNNRTKGLFIKQIILDSVAQQWIDYQKNCEEIHG